MYEWEAKIDPSAVNNRILWLRGEINRILNVTLRGSFKNPEDKKYWEVRAGKLNAELSALEQEQKLNRQ